MENEGGLTGNETTPLFYREKGSGAPSHLGITSGDPQPHPTPCAPGPVCGIAHEEVQAGGIGGNRGSPFSHKAWANVMAVRFLG